MTEMKKRGRKLKYPKYLEETGKYYSTWKETKRIPLHQETIEILKKLKKQYNCRSYEQLILMLLSQRFDKVKNIVNK